MQQPTSRPSVDAGDWPEVPTTIIRTIPDGPAAAAAAAAAAALASLADRLRESLGLAGACFILPDHEGSLRVHARSGRPLRLGRKLAAAAARVRASGVSAFLRQGATGRALALVPLSLPGEPPVGCLAATAPGPRVWQTAEVAALEGVAAGAAAEVARQRDRAEGDRRASLLEHALEMVPLGVTIADGEGRILYTNPAEASMHGYRVEDLFGRSARTLAPRELWGGSHPGRRLRRWTRERTNLRSDGSEFPVRLWSDPVLVDDHEVGLVTACLDLTSPWTAGADEAFRAMVELAPEYILRFDGEGALRYLNPAAAHGLEIEADTAAGRNIDELSAAAGERMLFAEAVRRVLQGSPEITGEGEAAGRWLRFRAVETREGALVFASDITEHRLREHRLARHAERDPLTGLLNREAFMRCLEDACAAPAPRFAVLFADLDRFKGVNDTLGHAAGDAVLLAVAERLASGVRPADCVARLGGDEFAVLVDGAEGETEAVGVVKRIQRLLEVPVHAGGEEVRVSASVGIALAAPGETPEAVLRSADRAMYRAKAMGPGHYGVLDSEMAVHEEAVLDARRELRLALERDQLVLHYQPIVALGDGRVVGLEALVRWRHPVRGLLGPQAFLPIAEQTGLIVELDRWVLRCAARQISEWTTRGFDALAAPVSINFSGQHIVRRDAADYVEGVITGMGINPASLVVEVTETSVMEDRESAAASLSRLRRMGIRVSLDDFGTGYSSLAYLRQLPFDGLKIDRSFVQRIHSSTADRAIVQSILALARTLGLQVTAEGVETAEQRAVLRRLGCPQAQGYLLSEPIPASLAERWLRAVA